MQVGRHLDDESRWFHESSVAVGPVSNIGTSYLLPNKDNARVLPAEEICLDMIQHCGRCAIPVRQSTVKMVGNLLCEGCRRSERERQSSLEDIRPASLLTIEPKAVPSLKGVCRVHPSSWTVEVKSDSEAEDAENLHLSSIFCVDEDAGFFRSMEVLTCFRSEVRRGLRLLSKVATAEKWHMCWSVLLSMCLIPLVLTLMVVAGLWFLVLSTCVSVAAVFVYPLVYINPRLYNYAMDS